ncbi:3-oxoacyl-[acyl-carrier-protein] synthase III C-terminal domain-containing protein [Enterovibrio baiacu]|uniref:3-oxoacyl-[acyl-carrier-protein] synthase III C-terminal domain-containing protein n=1 Tax=Enterovibrio baiacu TaxID=2491023 RepID=UPI00101061B5|nr:3-oxoacyl-[acyl-carrier-protein] synthase III C-terminal domain-containing protein [Enterovibrio baiacu]MBE1273876.1 3-oxoacyl-ACP synthase [Enterovibrio baiacu]
MFYISRNITADAPRVLNVLDDHDALFLSASSAKVFSQWYGFNELPFYDHTPCTEYYQQALQTYVESDDAKSSTAPATEPHTYDAVVHNHTGALCGVFGERVMLRSSRATLSNDDAEDSNWLPFSSSAAKCATPMQLMKYFERNRALNNILLVTGDIADNVDMRVNPVALSSDTINMVKLSRTPSDISVLSVATLFDGQFSGGIYLESNDGIQEKYNAFYQINVEKVVDRCLAEANLTREDIDVVLPHNVNAQTWKKLAAKLGIPIDKVYTKNIARYGHCFGGDLFVNLNDLYNELDSPQTVTCLAVAAGIGASFGATLFGISKGKETE